MDVAALGAQQGIFQTKLAMSMIKQSNQAEQALVNMIVQSSPSGERGQTLDVSA